MNICRDIYIGGALQRLPVDAPPADQHGARQLRPDHRRRQIGFAPAHDRHQRSHDLVTDPQHALHQATDPFDQCTPTRIDSDDRTGDKSVHLEGVGVTGDQNLSGTLAYRGQSAGDRRETTRAEQPEETSSAGDLFVAIDAITDPLQ